MELTSRQRVDLATAVETKTAISSRKSQTQVLQYLGLIERGDDARHLLHHMPGIERLYGVDLSTEKVELSG